MVASRSPKAVDEGSRYHDLYVTSKKHSGRECRAFLIRILMFPFADVRVERTPCHSQGDKKSPERGEL